MLEELIWAEKYRPKKISDTILTDDLKTTFQAFVDKEDVWRHLFCRSRRH